MTHNESINGAGARTLQSMALAPKFTEWLMGRIRPYLSGTVLEVGAGIGNNIRGMGDQELIIATEQNEEYIGILKRTFSGQKNIRIAQWDVTLKPPELPSVDSVLCSNVLEHIQDDGKALENMHSILDPGGRLVLVVPAGKWLFGSLDRAIDHFRRYEKSELVGAVESVGFKVDHVFSMNKVGVLGWFLNGRLLKLKSLGPNQLKSFDSLVPVFRALDPILAWQGLSLVVVARRQGQ